MQSFKVLLAIIVLSTMPAHANDNRINADAYFSIVDALQNQVQLTPSAFPLEARNGGTQALAQGLSVTYFGYGERAFSTRTDFHPAFDLGYDPKEIGKVKTVKGKTQRVRSPKTYLKRVYAIQAGKLVSIESKSNGFKMILQHQLEQSYVNVNGKKFSSYYTSYRHLDIRSIAYLTLLAREISGNKEASYRDLFGKHIFAAGDIIAFVGYSPAPSKIPPRAHLDFSLNMYDDPDNGKNIRDFSLNPLLLFRPFVYEDPKTYKLTTNELAAYQIKFDSASLETPREKQDGYVNIQVQAGGINSEGEFEASRYFALNEVDLEVFNNGKVVGTYRINRQLKLGYDTSSYKNLDNYNMTRPYFKSPLQEQSNIYNMGLVVPSKWLKSIGYDWQKSGKIKLRAASIWDGYLDGHHEFFEINIDGINR
jgi:hypothetical protein